MSDTNRVGVRLARNSDRTIPATLSPNELKALRVTGTPNLAFAPNSITSNELRPDRQISDSILVGAEAAGDVGFELSFGTFDDVIESALLSTWVNTPRKDGTSEITAFGAGTVTVDDDTDFRDDIIFRLEDLASGVVGEGIYVVTSSAANVITAEPFDANTNALIGSFTADADTKIRVVGVRANAAGEIDLDVTGTTATLQASAGSNFDDLMGSGSDLVAGQWVKIVGFSDANNNVWARLLTIASAALTFEAPTGAVTEAATGQVSIFFGDYIRNGAVALSTRQFAVERRFEDHIPITRELFLGMSVGQLSLQLQPQAIATGTVTFAGFSASVREETDVGDLYAGGTPTDTPSDDFDVYNTSSNVGRVGRGADPVASAGANFVLEATIQINNNLRNLPAVGVFGAAAVGVGEFSCSGNLNTYFDDDTLLNELLQNTDTSFDVSVISNSGRAMLFDLPRIKFTSGAPEVPGKNQDTVINLGYQALRSASLGYTLHTQRFHYAA